MTNQNSIGLAQTDPAPGHSAQDNTPHLIEEQVLPLYGEEVAISHRKVERTVRIHIRTNTNAHSVDEAVTHERVEIERIAIGLPVDAVPAVREEGDTTIIPVVEEVLVVERRLVLKEEIRLRRVRTTERHRETVILREQEAVVERTERDGRVIHPSPGAAPIPKPQALKDITHDG